MRAMDLPTAMREAVEKARSRWSEPKDRLARLLMQAEGFYPKKRWARIPPIFVLIVEGLANDEDLRHKVEAELNLIEYKELADAPTRVRK